MNDAVNVLLPGAMIVALLAAAFVLRTNQRALAGYGCLGMALAYALHVVLGLDAIATALAVIAVCLQLADIVLRRRKAKTRVEALDEQRRELERQYSR